ncbi:calcium homeostasis modulator protein 6 isoform X2 [Camelus ferus]|uniref:Calcium homeostasis modulator protein 6 isoform X2 n=2 Tax=Camelus TaxID=9836 RepID=A0A8B8TGD8_CAMFR|nr:calcium homeostasis modulator protein 6 isoform X2 [Camelus ferus]
MVFFEQPCAPLPCQSTWWSLSKNLTLLQVTGWVLIAVVIVVLLICTSVSRCLSPVSFLQLKFWKIYVEQEQEILKAQATEHATELARENIKCFFECSHPKEYNIPSIKDWQQISSLYTFNPKEQYYSTLHKYVNRKEKTQSIGSSEGDAVVPVLGFVDSPGIKSTTDL